MDMTEENADENIHISNAPMSNEDGGEVSNERGFNCQIDDLLLDDVLNDENLQSAFHQFLTRAWMAESLQAWLLIVRLLEMEDGEKKVSMFNDICEEFLLPNSPSLLNLQDRLLYSIRDLYDHTSKSAMFPLPPALLSQLRTEVWLLLATACLLPFHKSDTYREFKEGRMDSSADAFSRRKAEQFFGEKIEGPLIRQRIEQLRIVSRGGMRFWQYRSLQKTKAAAVSSEASLYQGDGAGAKRYKSEASVKL